LCLSEIFDAKDRLKGIVRCKKKASKPGVMSDAEVQTRGSGPTFGFTAEPE